MKNSPQRRSNRKKRPEEDPIFQKLEQKKTEMAQLPCKPQNETIVDLKNREDKQNYYKYTNKE